MHIATSVFLLISLYLIPSTIAREQYSNAKMVCLVNKERGRYGLRPLSMNPQLTKAAQSHCDYQARTRKMSHTGSGGSNPGQRAKQAGYNWRSVGENVAYGYDTMASVMKTWMNSPGHRANILNKSYTCMGSAVAYAGNTPYYTQDFGAGGSTAGQNAPKCDGTDTDYNTPSTGAQDYGNDMGGDYGGGNNDSGNDDYSGGSYGGQGGNDHGGRRGGHKKGSQGNNDYNSDMGGNDYGNDMGGNDYGNDMGGDYGGNNKDMGNQDYNQEQGGHGGKKKKPCKKGRKGGRKGGRMNQAGDYGGNNDSNNDSEY